VVRVLATGGSRVYARLKMMDFNGDKNS